MDPKIRVDIEELIERLNQMLEDGFATAEISIVSSNYIDDTTLSLSAVDISQDNNVEYGEVCGISEEFI